MPRRVALFVLTALILAAPWPVAGNLPYARLGFLVMGLLALLLAVVPGDKKQKTPRPFLMWLVLLLGIGYSAVQVIDLGVVGLDGPLNYPSKIEPLHTQVADAPNTISIYPAASKGKLVDLILASLIFVATSLIVRRSTSVLRVMTTIAIVGSAASFFGILQAVSWNGELFWQYELVQGGQVFGSFVNRNNAAGFLVISFCSALFLVTYYLINWREDLEREQSRPELSRRVERRRSKVFQGITRLLAKTEPIHLYVGLSLVTIMAGILMTLSRGGVLAMVASGLLVLVVSFLQKRFRIAAAIVTVMLLIVASRFVALIGFDEKLIDRFEQISKLELDSTPRLAHWSDMIPVMSETTLGTGGGTYRYLSPQFQTFDFDRIYAHAENIYIETLVELGYPGVVLIGLAVLLCVISSTRLMRSDQAIDQSLGLFGLATLLGTCLASVFDFGLYQPANAILMAVAMGVVVARAGEIRQDSQNNSVAKPAHIRPLLAWVALSVVIVSTCWATYYAYGYESYRWARRNINLAKEHKNSADALVRKKSLAEMESALATAAMICPDLAGVSFQQAELKVLRYQKLKSKELQTSIEESLEQPGLAENRRAVWESYTPEKIWTSTSLPSLNREIYAALREEDQIALQALTQGEEVGEYLRPAYELYQIANQQRFNDSLTNLRLAQLATLANDVDRSTVLVDQHLEIALARPYPSAQTLFDCGLIYLNSGDIEKAVELWSKCLRKPIARRYERPIVELSMIELPMQPFFERVLPQNPTVLLRVVKNYFRDPELILPKRLLLIHTDRVIHGLENELAPGEFYYFLAETARLSDQFDVAAERYQKALKHEPRQTIWRFEYARCLRETGNYAAAIEQLQKCALDKSPIFPRIKPLIERIQNQQNQLIQPSSQATDQLNSD
ncbi:MAG: O-antigen ligase family protein [Planctomycetota bacterium]